MFEEAKMASREDIMEIKKKLEEHGERIQKLERIVIEEGKEEGYKIDKSKEGIKRFAEKINVSKEDIKKTFDLDGNNLTLVKIIGEKDREKTINATLLVLLGYKYFFSKDEMPSQEIRRNVAENKIPTDNFATYLQEIIPSFIRRKGKPKSPKTMYKLTISGEDEAKELLKKYVKEDE